MKEPKVNSSYYRYRQARSGEGDGAIDGVACGIIDDVTIADLDLDSVFLRLDRCSTSPGSAMLYDFLRRPCRTAAELGSRWAIRDAIPIATSSGAQGCDGLDSRLRLILSKAGRQDKGELADEIWGWRGLAYGRWQGRFRAWQAFSLIALAVSILLHFQVALVLLALVVVNVVIYSKTTGYVSSHAYSIYYLCSLIRAGRGLAREFRSASGAVGIDKSSGEALAGIAAKLESCLKPLAGIPRQAKLFRASANVGGDIIDAIFEYLRVFLLQELSAYFKVYKVFDEHKDAIVGLYEALGLVDASLALLACLDGDGIGAARAGLSDDEKGFSAEGLVHPLVEGCIPNSVSFTRGAIVTGTNMAGKSTFLRAIGISQACATSLGLAFAETWRGGFLLVMSSMSCEDDLEGHKSRYFIEAERMMAILRASGSSRPVLALVDEILVGTNSEDRIFASVRMLRRIAGTSSLAIAATHDLPIAEALGGEYDCLHFSERIEGEELLFDYLVKPGVVDRRNALDILGLLGFDEEILGRA